MCGRVVGVVLLSACLIACVGCAISRPIHYHITQHYPVTDPQFVQTMGNLLGPPLVEGNRIECYENGDEIFPAMLEAIRGARRSVTFETYIYWSGRVGHEFADALAARARAGVKVHVLMDWMGSLRLNRADLREMKRAGVQVYEFHVFHIYDLHTYHQLNHRTHRKLLIVDGKVGFTGGVGIADLWSGHAQDPWHWRDNYYRVEGPVVAQLQAAFMDNWMQTTGVVLDGPDYFPTLKPAGKAMAQLFRSSWQEGAQSMELMVLMSIAHAAKSIRIESAYFVPDTLTRNALIDAARRGVDVEIITPGPHMDKKFVLASSRALWGKMLAAGVKIYEYQPTMLHCKLLIVDEQWTSIGSANIDDRSFRLNDEANLNVYDASFAKQQIDVFTADKARSIQITYAAWKHRPLLEQLFDPTGSLFDGEY